MSLYKRGNVYWIDYRVNGKRFRLSTGTTKRREAEYFHACRTMEAKEGKRPEIKETRIYKFGELAREYSGFVELQRGYRAKKTFIRQLVEQFGNVDLNTMDTLTVERWRNIQLKTHKPSTANRKLACLKHMFTKAVDWKMVGEETLKQVRKVKYKDEHNRRLRFLTIEECKTLIKRCAPHLKPIVTVALNTGMRLGEILSLRRDQVDLMHGFILLEISKNGERRQIPINTTLEYLFKDIFEKINGRYVFEHKDGKPYKEIKHSFGTALREADICDFTFHDLRHTFASHLVMQGIDLVSVKDLLGHKSLKMTLRYSHLSPGHKKKAVYTLDRLLSGSQTVKCDHDVTITPQNSLKQAVNIS